MTLQEYLNEKTTLLVRAGIDDAENEAWLCFEEGSGMGRSELRFSFSEDLSDVLTGRSIAEIDEIFRRRAGHEPLAYIVGRAPFYDLEFTVGPGVLIPRFDTEILVETALGCLGLPQMLPGAPELPQVLTDKSASMQNDSDAPELPQVAFKGKESSCVSSENVFSEASSDAGRPVRILDLCTGSGCVGITIAHVLQENGIHYELVMTDISPEAAAFARENAKRILGEENAWRVEICDLWPVCAGVAKTETQAAEICSTTKEPEAAGACSAAIEPETTGTSAFRADIIVSNPPYVRSDEMAELSPEVRDHEPAGALTDGGDGLLFYQRIFEEAPRFLAPGGVVAVEHGCEQGEAVKARMTVLFEKVRTIQDYGDLDRVTCGRLSRGANGGADER